MKITILDKLETFAYLVRSILRPVFPEIKIETNSIKPGYDLLISHIDDIKGLTLDNTKVLLIGKDIQRPLRGEKVLQTVKSWAIKNDLYTPMDTYVKKERKEEDYAEALEKSKELVKKREAKKLKKAQRTKRESK